MVKSKSKSKSNNFALFSDNCLYDKKGNKVHGPGVLCYLFIILESIFLIAHIVHVIYNKDKFDKVSKTRFYLALSYQIIFSLLSILFIYKMCYHCNGLIGIILLIVVTVFSNFLFELIFPTYNIIDTHLKIKHISDQLPEKKCNCK